MLQRHTIQKFHGDERAPAVFSDFVDGANVGMVQCGSSAGLAAEAFQGLRILRDIVRKKLECDETPEGSVLSPINHPHATAVKFLDDAEMRYGLADERVGAGHAQHILECPPNQVNEDQLLVCRLEPQ